MNSGRGFDKRPRPGFFGVAAFLVAVASCAPLAPAQVRDVPDPVLTPGVSRNLTVQQVCATKWGRDERHVSQAMKDQVFAEYGIPEAARHLPNGRPAFEIDHLISRELGGADDVRNLWSESYSGPCNAHDKDRAENRLHKAVCSGEMTLAQAQDQIRENWIAAFTHYFGSCQR